MATITQTVTRSDPPLRLQPSAANDDAIQLHQFSGDAVVHRGGGVSAETEDELLEPSQPEEAPSDLWDSKEGWPVVAAGSAIFFVYLGLIYSYGIVQLHLSEARLASVSTLSFIGSVGASISPLTAMIVARIINRLGHRKTAAIGAFFVGLGEFTAGWSTESVPAMFATQGFLFGIGTSLLFLPAATVPSLWFKRKRGLATGIVYGGAGVGSAVIALSLEKMISVVGLRSSLRILGALAWAICLPAAYFLKPPAGRGRSVSRVQWRLFRSLKFLIMLLMGALATFPLFVPPFLLPLYVSSVGLSSQAGAAILASWNLASAVGRIGMGFGADSLLGPLNSLIASLTIIGITSIALWPFASSLGLLIFFAILNGIGSGGFFSLTPVVVGAVFGDGELANIMSMIVTSWTFGYFMGRPLPGAGS
ncbi:unnamed protein product [Parascedosporium putredinis]|uniref:Major facilitator superfamily (MFS) profile domain-containing protein n=1 Tax=Parascedosporium putredinis TaxID=1442378 RepID=A0A9P1MA22_9PEZI|nr:unnamed protein product [Parascedosporium putredinis]CAI7991914.1 unnamed protein product [Parascedosporium putredinis]